MSERKTSIALAIAFAVATSIPAIAQVATDKDQNAHSYEGGPKTTVPHSMKTPQPQPKSKDASGSGGHHYSGGPKTESHHMGQKK